MSMRKEWKLRPRIIAGIFAIIHTLFVAWFLSTFPSNVWLTVWGSGFVGGMVSASPVTCWWLRGRGPDRRRPVTDGRKRSRLRMIAILGALGALTSLVLIWYADWIHSFHHWILTYFFGFWGGAVLFSSGDYWWHQTSADCPTCGNSLYYVKQYGRWFCFLCRDYKRVP